MTSPFTPPPEMVEACHHDAAEFKAARCPKCGAPLITNGLALWCSFIGGRDEPACVWMLDLRPVVTAAIAVLAPMIAEECANTLLALDTSRDVSADYRYGFVAAVEQGYRAIRSKFPSATGEKGK